jgi:uncharacterized protein (DUF2147 family)
MVAKVQAGNNPDAILGKWIAIPKKNFMVEVFREGKEYKARLAWFNDRDDPSKPMKLRMDEKNPEPELRKRKLLGMEVLREMVYNPKLNRWESGKIYDAKSGRIWSSTAWLTQEGILKVRGFWHFEFIGKNMDFEKVKVL